ncbi:MAG: phosphomannomutase/phosphoglucomutase [Candidatus Delongbacteria bacterium]|nr:phosphomannomutase/phosphoglucomutase [Candidatus Delongbacteria bacterium]
MNENIFREYDIRGVVEADFTPEIVTNIGRALATYLAEKGLNNCVIGFDARLSADYMFSTFSKAMIELGINITSIGQCTTPLLYFAQYKLEADASVMITGSHNPSDMNGLKMSTKFASIFGQEIQVLKNIILENKFYAKPPDRAQGKLDTISVKEDYLGYMKENINMGEKKLKVVVDGGNGTGGEVAAEIFRHFGMEVIELYTKPDGTFPNHHPDPTVPKNMVDLIAKVEEEKADLGIGYDGDADRIGIVSETGKMLFGDHLMLIFAKEILSRKPGATIIGEVKCSQTMYDGIEELGGRAIMWKAGHSLIKAKMKEENAELGGEVSGHIFFKDRFFGHDDALYASLRLLEIMSTTGSSISELLKDVPKTIMTPEIRLDSDDNKKFEIVKKAVEYFKNAGYKVNDVDGVRVIFDDGFGLLRASNTQPALVQRYEAQTQERLDEIMQLIQLKLKEIEDSL